LILIPILIGCNKIYSHNIYSYEPDIKKYWDEEKAIGILERNGKFIGIACLVLKKWLRRKG